MRSLCNAARLLPAALILFLCAAGASAQPPLLISYQGRLTDSSGAPITTARTVFFSLYEGGTAAGANSGTLRFREQATITPGSGGLFQHQIGSGTVQSGALTASLFNTSQPIYLQVAIGAVGTILLPRTQITSTGYSLLSATALSGGGAGATVTAVADVTGGRTVVGDLVRVTGSGLAASEVLIAGREAPIKSRSAGEIICQVPAGTPIGRAEVAVTALETSGLGSVVGHLDVRRLVVGVSASSGGTDNIFVIDALDRGIVAQLDPTPDVSNTIRPLQLAFAREGALAIIPAGANGNIIGVDLTANPPAIVQSYNDTNVSGAQAAASPPDGALVAVSSPNQDRVRIIGIDETYPPFSNPFNTNTAQGLNLAGIPNGFQPRASTFIGDSLYLVAGFATDPGSVRGFRRTPGSLTFGANSTFVAVGRLPRALDPTQDRTRVIVTSASSDNVQAYYVEPDGLTPNNLPSTGASGGANAWRAVVAPDGIGIIAADSATDDVNVLALDGANVLPIGNYEGAADSSDYEMAAIEPVEGKIVAVGTDNTNVQFFARAGGALTPTGTVTLSGSTGLSTVEILFQP